jgi:hypothetical protein
VKLLRATGGRVIGPTAKGVKPYEKIAGCKREKE